MLVYTGLHPNRAPPRETPMSEPIKQMHAVVSTMQEDAKQGPLARPLLIARIIAITAAVAGSIPTATNVYHSWVHGIPYNEVSHRLSQYDLWVKNFECKIDYRSLTTAQGTKLDAGACSKSGDVALKVTTAAGASAYEWIAFDMLQKAGQKSASVWSLLVSEAQAAEGPQTALETPGSATTAAAPHAAVPRTQIAQAGIQVVCQTLQSKSQIIRIVNEGGKCYRETFSPFHGKVEKRDEVPCNTTCPPAKG